MRISKRRLAAGLAYATLAGVTLLPITVAGAPGGAGPAMAAPNDDTTCGSPVTGSPVRSSGPPAAGYALNVGGSGELGTVWDPPENPQVAMPGVTGVDIVRPDGTPSRKVMVQFAENLDLGGVTPVNGRVSSTDGGATFPAGSYDQKPTGTRLRDGSLLGVDFKPLSGVGTDTVTVQVHRSYDEGATWTTTPSVFRLGATLVPTALPRTHGRVVELSDGTLLMSVYGSFTDAAGTRSQVQASTDGGRTFTRRGVIVRSDATHSYPEAAIELLPDGSLLSVVRHHISGELATPVVTRSVDGGVTWAATQPLSVSFPNGYDPFDDASPALLGVSPQLRLMPNGVMLLSSGRPDNWVAMSTNGLGTGWIGQLTYRNCPQKGYRLHGSTGNTGVDWVSGNRAVVVGDNCELTWACDEADEGDFTIDKDNRIWRRYVDVLTPDTGKIDLATKYRLGKVAVGGDLRSAVTGHPRARVDGAFDGSTEYWSSAVRASGSGVASFVLRLDRQYNLTRVGLSLRNGRQTTGRVYTSLDGVTWSGPVVTALNRTHHALEYFTLPATAAQYVKVEIGPSTNCDSGLGSGCAFLNELEVYSLVDSFENDPVNNRPRGWSDIMSGWVTRYGIGDNDSASALRISDNDGTAQARATWPATPAPTGTAEFRVNPMALPSRFLITMLGRDASGATTSAYQLAVEPDGSLTRWAGGGAWAQIAAAGTVKVGAWQTIRVTATTSEASIGVDGTTVADGMAPSAAVTALAGITFASAGAAATGVNVLLDDVAYSV
ncbi:F5/8 type C domain-containing protein [Micromonospora pisi]|uniref:F5/8 type C domain-containing protein n=1 Tax=Micromonospora pisi TaxID=589240 RepID=A0A495JU65_9ACTN|nr:exo-alpha-sialidase [Micromonospora pisi]RKR91904.1 F5/8 type C domain-containing protein [Micromonospora pisi]